MKRHAVLVEAAVPAALGVLVLAGLVAPACSEGAQSQARVSSRSYQGHESDVDITNFVNAYPATVGSRLDDCQTCHKNAVVTDSGSGDTTQLNPCDYCHLIPFPSDEYSNPPTAYRDTLNPYGLDYVDQGRSQDALLAIDARDSDGDGFGNGAEIADLRYPGDPNSKPGQPVVELRTFDLATLQAMAPYEEFLLANTNRQQFDDYVLYKGVKVAELLVAAGVDLADPELAGITVAAPDGFLQDVPMSAVTAPFPTATFYGGLDVASLGSECGFVTYPSSLPDGVADGQPIPGEQWLLLGYERNGAPMAPVTLDVETGKIDGEGPLRLVVPQNEPGPPDRGATFSPTTCNDGYDYDETADHNGGAMVRGVVSIRVNPLPAGTEDFDYQNGGWAFIDGAVVAVYGHGVVVP